MTIRRAESKPRRLWRIGKAAACGVFVGAVGGGRADRLILFPSTNPINTAGMERHVITAGGREFDIWRCKSPSVKPGENPQAYVLAFIGNGARAESTAPIFASDWGGRPVEVWAVNYSGYGGSSGPARVASIAPMALAAFDALHAIAGDRPIFVHAQSRGTAAGLYVAAHRPVAGCVLHNPPPLRRLILGRFGWWNLWLLAGPVSLTIPRELDSISNAKVVKAPAVFLMADADDVVPPGYQQLVFDAYAGAKRLVHLPEAGHNDRATGESLSREQAGLHWLWRSAALPLDSALDKPVSSSAGSGN